MLERLPLLLLVTGSLVVGPALAWVWPSGKAWRALLDGLSLSLVGGLCLLHLAPHAVLEGGLWSLAAGAIGLVGPALAHRTPGRRVWLVVAALAVLVHSAIDGAAIGVVGGALSLAVVGHQLPVGLAIWTLAGRVPRGPVPAAAVAWGAIGAVALATVVGFVVGAPLVERLPESVVAPLEALVAGGLLHVILDAATPAAPAVQLQKTGLGVRAFTPIGPSPHGFVRVVSVAAPETCCEHHATASSQTTSVSSSVGALLGGAAIAVLVLGDPDGMEHVGHTVRTFVSLVLDSAPALVIGYALAGLAAALLPEVPPGWLSAGGRVGQAVKGVVFGLPLPVCSCGVLPLYESLARRGVPATAALAFLVATPELGPDAVLLTVPLLGAPFAVVRVVAAAATAVVVALLVGHTLGRANPPSALHRAPAVRPLGERLKAGLHFATAELVDHTLPWVTLGLVAAALAEPLLGHDLLRDLPPAVQVPVFAVVGVPLYVCASGATPLAAVAVHKGVSAGAALAFLLAGPATNLTTFAVLGRLHGSAVAWRFGAAVIGVAVLAGWTVDALGIPVVPAVQDGLAVEAAGPVGAAAALLLAALGTASLFRQGARGVVQQIVAPNHHH